MRLSGIINDDELYKQGPGDSGLGTPSPAPQEPPTGGTAPGTPPETPAETPGPNGNPQGGQGGPPPATPPSQPPQVGQGGGGIASEATGGIEGTFAQAGTPGFAQRFGGDNPAFWFRSMPQGRGGENSNRGGNSGGAIPAEGSIPAPSEGGVGGNKNDEEWQRFMREVNRLRFGRM